MNSLFDNKQDLFTISRWAYAVGSPVISDIEYGHLEGWIKQNCPNHPLLKQTWGDDDCPVALLEKYNREDLIRAVELGYFAESIPSINSLAELAIVFGRLMSRSRLSYKIDGWNTRVNYYNGKLVRVRTRGRTGNSMKAECIRNIVPKEIPIKGKVSIVGETNIPNSKWALFQLETGNSDQRASVSTALANGEYDVLAFAAFDIEVDDSDVVIEDKYETLKSFGFTTPAFMWVSDYDSLLHCIDIMSARVKSYNMLTDGLVLETPNEQKAIRVGAWQENAIHTYVAGYEETQGKHGNSMVLLLHPVVHKGKKYSRVNITNIANIVDNDLYPGSPVAFVIRSAADIVLDVTTTAALKKQWDSNLEEYQRSIDKET